MKKLPFLIIICLFFGTNVFADRPSIYCEIINSHTEVSIKPHILWNVDINKNRSIPESYITGNEKHIARDFILGNNYLELNFYFPKQLSGRALNKTTTVHITAYLNKKLILNSKYFGLQSEFGVGYGTDILCRPDFISFRIDDYNNLKIKIRGKYIPNINNEKYNSSIKEKQFDIEYLNPIVPITDFRFAYNVLKNNPELIAKNSNANLNKKQYSKTSSWGHNKFILDSKYSNNKQIINDIKSLRALWRVGVPIIASYTGTNLIVFGNKFQSPYEPLYLSFTDANGRDYNFGYGNNYYSNFNLDENNSKYMNKTFKIYWEWQPSKYPFNIEEDTILVDVYYPSILKLELIEN